MRFFAFVALGLVMVSSRAFAADGGADAGLDASNDAAADASDDAAGDASDDANADAAPDASADAAAKDASSGSDASGLCCPSLPCTCAADASNDFPDAGDDDAGAGSGGCSCQSVPLDAGTVSPLLLLAGAALVRARTRKKK